MEEMQIDFRNRPIQKKTQKTMCQKIGQALEVDLSEQLTKSMKEMFLRTLKMIEKRKTMMIMMKKMMVF